MTAAVLRLKVTLDDVEPQVLRRIEDPADIKLDRLHLTLQAALGWLEPTAISSKFALGDRLRHSSPDWPDGPLDARKAELIDAVEDASTKTLRYLRLRRLLGAFKVERITEANPGIAYPRLIEASGRCPPEDVGGPWGYAEMLETLADPEHERHDELREWIGEEYDPNAFNAAAREAEVAALAKQWSRKPRARPPSSL